MLYNTLVLPYISYCNIIWATHKCNTNRILMLQKKSIRVCTDAGYRDHTDPLFATIKTLKISDIHYIQKSLFMFRLKSGILPHQ